LSPPSVTRRFLPRLITATENPENPNGGSEMTVYQLDPVRDPRWNEFINTHPKASIFHTSGWLECLQRTYGYEPLAFTTNAPGSQLTNGIAFCAIKSRLTGRRMVSVPFADHCQPLFESLQDFHGTLEWLGSKHGKKFADYIEIRPLESAELGLGKPSSFHPAKNFRIHLLDLSPSTEQLLKSFDKSSVQRRLRRVERESLVYEEGNSPEILKTFYRLQVMTRRKHQIPPQPISWFANLLNLLGDKAKIRVVAKDGVAISSILTLAYNGTVVYKYGCSDAAFNSLAGTPFLFWHTIQDAKQHDFKTFDMGRSDLDNPGLINFKSNWGTKNTALDYWCWPQAPQKSLIMDQGKKAGGYVVSRLPDSLLTLLGRTLYKHAG
jgi:hypothetical protein